MEQTDRKFIEDNIINFESVKLGFVRNMPLHILVGYEQIYKKYVDPGFVLVSWCGACIHDMFKRLVRYYEGLPKPEPQPEAQVLVENEISQQITEKPKPKRGRPKVKK